MIRVTIFNEFFHEKSREDVQVHYPNGIHMTLKEKIEDEDIAVQTVTLDNVNDITEELLQSTDVMIWWAHRLHGDVPDHIATRVQNAVLSGMGMIFLHSAHHSKPFKLLMGTPCSLGWRQHGDSERVWVCDPSHPIAQGIDRYIKLEHEETYSEPFSIPTKDLNVLTSFEDVKEIVEELGEISSMTPSVILSGFGSTGINPGKIAGGFDFANDFGSDKERKALEKLCQDKNINLYSDFDLIQFSKSGNGFTAAFDSAKSASLQAVKLSPIETPLRKFDKDNRYRIIKREKLDKAVDKLIKATDKLSVSGVSISTLSSIAYSDYTEEKYYSKGNMGADVMGYIAKLQKAEHNVAAVSANAYAAAAANTVYSVPVSNGGYYAFDKSIPLYQMIFGASKPLYSEALNVAANTEKAIMQSVSTGTRLSFCLIDDFDISDIKIQTERFYGSVFEDNEKLISETLKKYEPFYKAIKNASIKDYQILDANITKTVFDNGTVVYANHATCGANSPVGELKAYEVRWTNE